MKWRKYIFLLGINYIRKHNHLISRCPRVCASILLDENNRAFQISDQAVKSADQAARIGTGVVWVWEQPNGSHLHKFLSSGAEERPGRTTAAEIKMLLHFLLVLCMGGTTTGNHSCLVCRCFLNHKACSVPTPLRCSQHFYSVTSGGLFFVLLLYTVGYRNSVSMLHLSSLRIAQAASSLSNYSCIHMRLVGMM